MSDDEVEAALTDVPGVGPWTAHGFLLIALDRPDVFFPGDLALRRAIERAYGFDHAPTEQEPYPVPGFLTKATSTAARLSPDATTTNCP